MTRTMIQTATIPAVNLYGHARDLTITIYKEWVEGWDRETQTPDPYMHYTTVLSGATDASQGNGTEADARQNANTMYSWYAGLSERHPTFKANKEWSKGDRLTRRPW